MGKGGFYGNVFRIIPLIITLKFQRKNCGAKVIRLVIEGEEVVEVGAEKEGDVRRAIVIAEARLISTQMSSSRNGKITRLSVRLNRRHRSTSLGFLRGGELCRAGFSAPAPPLIDLASQFISDSLPIRTIKLGLE
ncbi:hypothetical protein F2Q69_00038959 [Brassica cretica]|uniref:Uncharacterized protein n=1 Tax=Brassica cretica TaxID=69181 RepID=A0A8S9SG23_BRACR|nr:hypothetical protein F2Q69_00038959 [Brassica cretica]